ncbi:RRP15-like protein isoform X2 [Anoplophora glabripennis]|uniref:RRP15-like protein isoform X2 n=1 Tax=Anoplophora glabripennis TaxID=217634 RepID=UPI000873E85F|nr:RRP15-like protein isoform X2 [Anoplophora glabripennis]
MAKKKQINLEDRESSEESGEASGAEGDVSDTNENEDNGLTNSGWADSISKILKTNKPKGKKTIVLSKAKKLTDLRKEKSKPAGFEVQTVSGEVKEEKVDITENVLTEEPPQKKRRTLSDLRVKPNILEKDRERTLQKIATKGVVQLFNAVKSQQKQISEKLKEAGPLEVRKEKVLKNIDKRAFLDVLMGEKSQKIDDVSIKKVEPSYTESQKKNESVWSVLKDDFMMSAKMKDWDKVLEESDNTQIVTPD